MGSLNSCTFIGRVIATDQGEFKVRLGEEEGQTINVSPRDWLVHVIPLLKTGQLVFGERRLEGPQTDRFPSVLARRLLPIDNVADVSGVSLAPRELHQVKDHVRKLPSGMRASQEARVRARAAGVRLPEGTTFVKSHARGEG